MFPVRVGIFALGLTGLVAAVPKKHDPLEVIERDVLIIGGGATGTYAAIRLREDYKKSVLVIEKNDKLGYVP